MEHRNHNMNISEQSSGFLFTYLLLAWRFSWTWFSAIDFFLLLGFVPRTKVSRFVYNFWLRNMKFSNDFSDESKRRSGRNFRSLDKHISMLWQKIISTLFSVLIKSQKGYLILMPFYRHLCRNFYEMCKTIAFQPI